MNIAVYSGSFNPLHIGHLAIIRHLIDKEGYDMVYLIVSPKNPLKEGISSSTGLERYNAALEAVQRRFPIEGRSQKVKVDDIELNLPEPHYTIHSLDALKVREPDNRFTLVMGADNLADIRRWKDYKRILSEFGVAVFPRIGTDIEKTICELHEENPDYNISIIDAPLVNISSTQIRESLSIGEDMSSYLM